MAATSHGSGVTPDTSERGLSTTGTIQLVGLLLAAAIGAFAGFAPGTTVSDSDLSGSLSLVTEDRSSGSVSSATTGGASEQADAADAPYQGVARFPSDDADEATSEPEQAAAATEDASDALTPVGDTDTDEPAGDSTQDPAAPSATSDEPTTVDDREETEEPAAPLDPAARGQAALGLISYPWQDHLPGWTISFHPEKSGLYGLTLVSERRIEVYVRNGQSEALLAHVIAHEIGHAVDVTLNDGPERRLWEETRKLNAPWWPGNGTNDFSTGAGDFAESFAAWQVGGGSFRSELGPPPDQEARDLLALLSTS